MNVCISEWSYVELKLERKKIFKHSVVFYLNTPREIIGAVRNLN